ncbi:MAG: SDR family NAD(P)-dependent oxidoreductase [Akkermansiaceae bacterium]|nr:SDR family NAD(P)-dependent oxidoreductase [Akkermansiaceae bacterium]NJR43122.1 SDR family NAD(P)-dependent oxidoreductase [Akkermansiaceae bacterium]
MKRIVITGGHGGLARALVMEFTANDWQVDAPGRDELDVSNYSSIEDYFNDRSVDLLICAAGLTLDAPLVRITEDAWDEVLAVNYQGAAACSSAALPEMIRQGYGHIVFISSYSAIHPPTGQVAYATAKAALIGLTQSMAQQYGRNNIRVNAILPGFLETPMTEKVSPKRKVEILAEHHLEHFNTPEIVAKFIHQIHENLPFTSGQIFQLDSRSR